MTVLRMQIVPILYRELVFSKAKGDRRIFHLASSPYPSHLATTALAEISRYSLPVIVDQIEKYLQDTIAHWQPTPLPPYYAP